MIFSPVGVSAARGDRLGFPKLRRPTGIPAAVAGIRSERPTRVGGSIDAARTAAPGKPGFHISRRQAAGRLGSMERV